MNACEDLEKFGEGEVDKEESIVTTREEYEALILEFWRQALS